MKAKVLFTTLVLGLAALTGTSRQPGVTGLSESGQFISAMAPDHSHANNAKRIASDITPPDIYYSGLLNTGSLEQRTLLANITDESGIPASGTGLPVLYWKINDGSWNACQGVYMYSDQYSFTFGSGVVAQDVVSYYIAAQDNASPSPNATLSPFSASSVCVANPPSSTTPPPNPSSYLVLSGMCGDFTVGTGGDFSSLTGSGGLFEFINSSFLSCDVNVKILSDLTEDGTFALSEWTEEGAGNYSLTITPLDNTLKTISGSSSSSLIRLNGAKRVIVDGGADKSLLFRNSVDPANGGAGATIQYLSGCTDDLFLNCIAEGNPVSDVIGVVSIEGISGNFNITISNNKIRNTTGAYLGSPSTGIYASVAYADSLKILGNHIYNWSSKGIYFESVPGSSRIANNSFFYNLPTASATEQVAIYVSGSGNPDISSNFIGGQAPLCAGLKFQHTGASPFTGIYLDYSQVGAFKSSKFFGPTPCQVNNNTIQNINIENVAGYNLECFTGIRVSDGPADIGNQAGNLIGSLTGPNSITVNGAGKSFGIYAASLTDQARIENNTISYIALTGTTGSAEFTGIYTNSGLVNKNKVRNIGVQNTSLTPVITGIYDQCNPSFSNMFGNNLIALDGGSARNPVLYGIRSTSENHSEFYYNSVSITGPATETSPSFAFHVVSENQVSASNNIFSNSRAGGGTGKHYAVFSGLIPGGWQSDYNDLYSSSSPLAYWNVADIGNLDSWRTATGGDSHSVSVNPLFASASDLHTNVAALDNTGIFIPDIFSDLDGNLITEIPDMGCYQFSAAPTKTLHLVLYLEGLYTGSGTMHPALDGTTGLPQWGTGIADKITVQLHEATSPYNAIGPPRVAELLTSGSVQTSISGAYGGNYYIAVMHRNSISIWSASPVSFAASAINYNFSDLASKAYGSNLRDMGGIFAVYCGDADADGAVIDIDLLNVENSAAGFMQGYLPTDMNGDGTVDALDLILTDNNAAKFVGVKKP